jgi:hypothetical protein
VRHLISAKDYVLGWTADAELKELQKKATDLASAVQSLTA